MKPQTLKFKKNESFYIRDGWFEKAINTIQEHLDDNIFSKNKGISYLGIGSNMVKGLRYWLQASRLINSNVKGTTLGMLGENVFNYDRYFEDNFTWFMIHYYLCINYEDCPIFYGVFNSDLKSFKKTDIVEYLMNKFRSDGFETKQDYIDSDTSIFLKSYIYEGEINNPEDNYVCPLSRLKLLRKDKDKIERCRPIYNKLSYLIIYHALANLYDFKPFKIEDSFYEEKSPYLIFNLDKNMYLQYLEEMRKNELITINKTAGLNTVYFEKKLTLSAIFKAYFEGE